MTTIVTRVGKGSPLTWTEVDSNFTNLNNAKYESGNNASFGTISGTTITASSGFSGALNGTVGATTPASGAFTSLTDSGNLTFTGTGNRITGDFSNATVSNRVAFQTSTINGVTNVGAIPSGTGNISGFFAYNGADGDNASLLGSYLTSTVAIINSSKNGTGTYLPMTFYTGGSERMRIDTSGNVGINGIPQIGISSQTEKFQVLGTDGPTCAIASKRYSADATGTQMRGYKSRGASIGTDTAVQSGDGLFSINGYGYTGSQYTLAGNILFSADAAPSGTILQGRIGFFTTDSGGSNAERMRIDSSGNVGIGTTNIVARLVVYRTKATSSLENMLEATVEDTAGGISNTFRVECTPSSTPIVNLVARAGGNQTTSALAFITRISGTEAERMRIDSSGNLLVGTATSLAGRATIVGPTTAYGVLYAGSNTASDLSNPAALFQKYDNNTTTSQVLIRFLVNNGNTQQGQINANGASTAAFGSYSDARLKENIVDLPSQLGNIMALRPVEFDYIGIEDGHQIGFIAQEMQEVYPDVVAAGTDEMLMITGWSKTEARLVKAIQELKAIVDEQAEKIKELEAKLNA